MGSGCEGGASAGCIAASQFRTRTRTRTPPPPPPSPREKGSIRIRGGISDKRSSGNRRRAAPSQHPIPIGTTVAPSMHKPQMCKPSKSIPAQRTQRAVGDPGEVSSTQTVASRGAPGGSVGCRRVAASPQRASAPRAPSEKRASSSCSCAPHGRRVMTPGSRSTKQRPSPDLQREGRHESSALEPRESAKR